MQKAVLFFFSLLSLSSQSAFSGINFEIEDQARPVKKACGLRGTLNERVSDCSRENYSGKSGSFVLVTRTEGNKEIFFDSKTKMLWGDLVHYDWTLYKSAQHTPHYMTLENATLACQTSLDEMGNFKKLHWTLPTIEDWLDADQNGLRLALPDMQRGVFWSRTEEFQGNFAIAFNASTGGVKRSFKGDVLSVRCVSYLSK